MPQVDEKKVHFQIKEFGLVKGVKKFIAKVEGLPGCMGGQVIEFSQGIKGLVTGFTQKEVLALVLGDETKVRAEDSVYSKTESFNIPAGEDFLGRIVSPLGEPRDGKGAITPSELRPLFKEAPSTMDRGRIEEQLYTGIKMVDSIIPIAKGQKQLIIGDRMTGKTAIATNIILNQKGKDVVCIYCCIGKSFMGLLKVVQLLQQREAFKYTIIVSAVASSSTGEQYLAPYAAVTLGEYFMYKGQDVVVVFDDLTKHAWVYREISLLMERSPGREAYPGDIFYIHSQLLERGGKLNSKLGGGSMTFFPVAETLEGDVTGYIPSNLISMTDGQVYLNAGLFSEGFKPAIDLNLSVSTIGSRAQEPILKQLTSDLRFEYAQYRQLLPLARLKAGFSKEAESRMRKGEIISELLMQGKNVPLSIEEMIILFFALKSSVLDNLSDEQLEEFKGKIYSFILESRPDLIKSFKKEKKLTVDMVRQLEQCLGEFFRKR